MKSRWGRGLLVGLGLGIWACSGAGCLFVGEVSCQISTDCPDGMFCQMGSCVEFDGFGGNGESRMEGGAPGEGASEGESWEEDEGAEWGDEQGEIEEPEEPHPCPSAPAAFAGNLVLNEFLANVPTGESGDANQDGVRDAYDDEFVELVNISDEMIDLTGVEVRNDRTAKFVFPAYCLAPMEAVVVFGGVEGGGELRGGEGWEALVADSRFSYANGEGRVVVVGANEGVIADVSYGAHPAQSLTLNIDRVGADYVVHGEVDDERIFSPGSCADGRSFVTGCVQE